MSPKGEYFETKRKASRYLIKCGGTEEEKSLLEEFMMTKSNEEKILREISRSVGEGFKEEFSGKTRRKRRLNLISSPDSKWMDRGSLLPNGWRMKGEIGSPSCKILSSKDRVFQTLRQHFRFMVKQGFLHEEVEEVRSKMVLHGWQEDQLLPRGWTYKVKKSEHRYCTREGDLISGHKNVLTKLRNSEVEAIGDFILFTKKQGGEVTRDLSKFKPSPYLPKGWLCSEFTNGNHINIVSLEGQRYQSYKMAAAFMKADIKYTSFDIEKLFLYPDGRKHLQSSSKSIGWVKSEYLPPGWRCKPGIKGHSIMLKNPAGKRVDSYSKAFKMMAGDGSYTKEDVEKLSQYPDGRSHKTFPVAEIVTS